MARQSLPTAPANTASINVRLSKEAREQNLSKDGMVEDCIRLCEAEGLAVIAVHVDDGLSGAIRDRPGFVAWLNDAKHLRADHLIAWHVDRMTREGVNVAGMILDTIEGKDPETGKVIRQPARLLDTKGLDSAAGDNTAFRFQFVIAAEVARAERERMRDRSRSARRRASSSGRWAGGPPPFGFCIVDNPDGPGRALSQVDHEAAFVREAASRVLAGATISSVVRWANGPEGCAPRRAAAWGRRTLVQVLTGYPAAGRVVRIVDGHPVPVLDADGQPVRLPAILTADESAALRTSLAPKRTARPGGRQPARLLSRLLICHGCNRRMRVSRKGDRTSVYRCQDGREAGTCRHPVGIAAEAVEDYVTEHFLSRWGDTPAYVRRAEVTGAAAVEETEAAVSAVLADLSTAPTPENLARLQEVHAQRAKALAAPKEAVVRLVPTGRTIRESWDISEIPERRTLLATNYAAIIVRPGRHGGRFDGDRLVVIAQPPYPVDASDGEGFTPGSVVI